MKKQIITSLKMLGLMTLLLGIIYPLCITGISQLVFPNKAHGSLIEIDGEIRGSKLIGQKFDSDQYFNMRPSATGYNTLPSGGTNWGMTSEKLHDTFHARLVDFKTKNGLTDYDEIPTEMLFASASGLDPHISPQGAKVQISRIAKARSLTEKQIQEVYALVDKLSESPQFGLLGKPRINVFVLNLELDKVK